MTKAERDAIRKRLDRLAKFTALDTSRTQARFAQKHLPACLDHIDRLEGLLREAQVPVRHSTTCDGVWGTDRRLAEKLLSRIDAALGNGK